MPTIPDVDFAAVLGDPVEHSLSPTLHRAAYAALGVDWRYEKFRVPETEFGAFIDELPPHCRGLSLTMPLKAAAFQRAVAHDEASTLTRACNTLIPGPHGWRGFNTDVPGFVSALRGAGVTSVETAVVLGAGATARSAIVALQRLGVGRVALSARRAAAVDDLRLAFPTLDIERVEWGAPLPRADVVVSTLPGGVADDLHLPAALVVFDVVYAPWPTRLAQQAKGRTVLGGLDLLVAQAVEQVLLMTGADESLRAKLSATMYAAGLVEQAQRTS